MQARVWMDEGGCGWRWGCLPAALPAPHTGTKLLLWLLSTHRPPPLCINTTTFFHDPIHPQPGAGHPGILGTSLPHGLHPRRQQWAGFLWPGAILGGAQTLKSPPLLPRCPPPSTPLAPGRGSAQEAGRQATPVECVWASEGTGWVGQRGELEVPVRWLSEPGVGVC